MNFKILIKLSTCLIFSVLLGGCLNLPTSDKSKPADLSETHHWFLKSRIAIQSPQENLSATLDWQKSADNFDFHIYGLFGATYAHLIQTDEQAVLKLPEDKIYYHHDAEQLLLDYLGWHFPVEALSFWIKGLPSGKLGERLEKASNGSLEVVYFEGWKIEFSRYQSFSDYILPKMIKASHPEMTLKIVVKDWDFSPSN